MKPLVGALLVLVLSACFPTSEVRQSYFRAVGIYRFEVYDFDCDPARVAREGGQPFNLLRSIEFFCTSKNGKSTILVQLQGTESHPYQVSWAVPHPVTDTVTLTTDKMRNYTFHKNSHGYSLPPLFNTQNGKRYTSSFYGATFEFEWSDEAVLKGSFQMSTE
jgi:hypothetical protein